MSNLYPPILDSQADSIANIPLTSFSIPFTMPLSVDADKIGHIQVLIRRQANMEAWSSQTRPYAVPERDVIYLEPTYLSQVGETMWRINVPIELIRDSKFSAGSRDEGEIYTIQIRFGDNQLTYSSVNTFANWKQQQIVESAFGEWSNTQRMFVYALKEGSQDISSLFKIDYLEEPIAKLAWTYTPVSIDPLSQVRITYSWSTPDSYGNSYRSKNVEFTSHDGRGASAAGEIDLGIMRFAQVIVTITFITINNTVYVHGNQNSFEIPPFSFREQVGVAGSIQEYPVVGEEIEDGVLGMGFNWNWVGADTYYYKIFRTDARSLETILLKDQITKDSGVDAGAVTVKDYSVEMGAEYIYMAFAYGKESGRALHTLVWDNVANPLTPKYWNPPLYPGYGRHMNFQGNLFLTTKWQQLKLQGNVSISNFQRNTSDQFTTTIGGQYPFYSRSAQFNYRTFQMQALVSMNFDMSNTFLQFKEQIATTEMDIHLKAAVLRYQQVIAAGRPKYNLKDPAQVLLWNKYIADAQKQYYIDITDIYSGINPLTGLTFLPQRDKPLWMTGQLWLRHNQDNDQLILRATELFSEHQYSYNTKRTQDFANRTNERFEVTTTDNYFISSKNGVRTPSQTTRRRGPISVFDPRLARDATHVINSDRQNDIIYAERKFREAVMSWLAEGTPKLLRSETEGNMIVVLSGINFTPFNKSRQVYSVSATVTEIAEYNLENLITYGLVPVNFESFYLPHVEFGFIAGDKDHSIGLGDPYQIIVSPAELPDLIAPVWLETSEGDEIGVRDIIISDDHPTASPQLWLDSVTGFSELDIRRIIASEEEPVQTGQQWWFDLSNDPTKVVISTTEPLSEEDNLWFQTIVTSYDRIKNIVVGSLNLDNSELWFQVDGQYQDSSIDDIIASPLEPVGPDNDLWFQIK